MNIFPRNNEVVNNPIYLTFAKPIVTPAKPAPIIIKSLLTPPFMWNWNPIPHKDKGVGNRIFSTDDVDSLTTLFATEESYIVRPNEGEMQMRVVQILSGGVYTFLKEKGLLKEIPCEIGKRYGLQEMKLDEWFRELTKGRHLS
jgi:hypothetical protein